MVTMMKTAIESLPLFIYHQVIVMLILSLAVGLWITGVGDLWNVQGYGVLTHSERKVHSST